MQVPAIAILNQSRRLIPKAIIIDNGINFTMGIATGPICSIDHLTSGLPSWIPLNINIDVDRQSNRFSAISALI